MHVRARIEKTAAPTLDAMGYELVRVRVSGSARPTVQIMAERRDGAGMTVDDCSAINHAISAVLDVEDPIGGAYTLEISSPGIDRPLTRSRDFERFAGFDAKVEMRGPIDGRRRFQGRILGLSGDEVRLATQDGEIALPIVDIHNAKLLMTDELLAAAARG
jgi:ribosome maturation factor RimP